MCVSLLKYLCLRFYEMQMRNLFAFVNRWTNVNSVKQKQKQKINMKYIKKLKLNIIYLHRIIHIFLLFFFFLEKFNFSKHSGFVSRPTDCK